MVAKKLFEHTLSMVEYLFEFILYSIVSYDSNRRVLKSTIIIGSILINLV